MHHLLVVDLLHDAPAVDCLNGVHSSICRNILPIPRTSCVTPKTLDNMLKSVGSAYPRSLADRPDRREFNMLAFMYAAAVMMLCAPANVCRTRAILYDPFEISFADPPVQCGI